MDKYKAVVALSLAAQVMSKEASEHAEKARKTHCMPVVVELFESNARTYAEAARWLSENEVEILRAVK